jgi:Ran GTPase-activating protein (RanGAP) involved in mRNA processing and transport
VRLLKKTYSQQDTLLAPSRELDDLAMLETGMALQGNKSIKTVDLPHQNIKRSGLLYVLQELYDNNTVTSMDLSYNMMGTADTTGDEPFNDKTSVACTAMAEVLNSDVTVVEALNLEMNHLSPSGGVIIGESLASNKSLKTLRLNDNEISSPGALAIGTSLSLNTTLLFLDLNNNKIDAQGLRSLSDALCSSTALKVLYLEKNNIGVEGCKMLARGLKENTTLKNIR